MATTPFARVLTRHTTQTLRRRAQDTTTQDSLITKPHAQTPTAQAALAAAAARRAAFPPHHERYTSVRGHTKLRPAVRAARFAQLRQRVDDRVGRRPTERASPVRNAAIGHLLELAQTEGEVEQVVALFARWRDGGRALTPPHAELLVRRCAELKCPALALRVFGDFGRYGLALPSVPAAQRLVHALHLARPVGDTIAAAALLDVYGLPPLAKDPLLAALVARACLRHAERAGAQGQGAEAARTLARALVPPLRAAVRAAPRGDAHEGKERARRLAWALLKVGKALKRDGQDVAWLTGWLERARARKAQAPADAQAAAGAP